MDTAVDNIAKNTCDVFIKSQIETRTAFGVRLDIGETVFVNAELVKKFTLEVGTVRKLVLAPNPSFPNTPWQAIGISMGDTGPPRERPQEASESLGDIFEYEDYELEGRIVKMFDIEANQFASECGSLAMEMDVSEETMQLALDRMHNAGEMAKAKVFARGRGQPISVLWARKTSWFSL